MIRTLQAFFTGLFFIPYPQIADDPASHDVSFETLYFSTADGRRLHGYFFKPKTAPRGTIVHCHGNAGNITVHFSLMLYLVEAGYNVLSFDYGGYGESEGKPSLDSIVADTLAALAAMKKRPDVDPKKIALFGQSLGGAAAAGAMAKDSSIQCLVLEGTFTTFQEMSWSTHIGRLLFFLVPFVIPKGGPAEDLPKIAPRPVLIVHGDEDNVVPGKFAPRLYKAAPHHASLVILSGFGHIHGADDNPEYKQAVLTFLAAHLI